MALFKVTAQRAQFDLSDNNSTDVYGAGIRFDQNGFARATTSAGTFFNQGIPMSASGQVSIVDATAGLPSGTIFHNGLPISGEKVCVSRNATSVVSSGLPFDSNGALAADLNLDLNFVNATTLDSNITFTRGSNATQFDSSGNLVYAPNNAIRNNTMVGAVAGTPGTLPTNWLIGGSGSGTLTREVVGVSTSDGITYVDLRFSGTTSTTDFNVAFEPGTQIAALPGQVWTESVYLAVVGGSTTNITNLRLQIAGRNSGGTTVETFLSPGLLGSITNSLQRVVLTATLANATTVFVQPNVRFDVPSGVAIDITLRIGLPQLQIGPTATAVNRTSGTAYYGPRFDYNPATLAAQGLLIEEQRTNSIRNNTMQGAVAGTPGTAPTNWAANTGAGITRELIGVGVESGITYIDYRFSGTGSVVSDTQFDQSNIIAAASGQTWAHSIYCKVIAGSLNNITLTQILSENSAAGGFLASSTQNITPTSAALGTQRFALTRTLNNASTAFTAASLRVQSTGAINITLRIGLPQLEQGAFATSVIPTTTTALTRNADVARVNTLSPWYNETEGTLYAEVQAAAGFNVAGLFGRYAAIQDALNNNSVEMFFDGPVAGAPRYRVRSGGVNQAVGSSAIGYTANSILKASLAYKVNDFAGVSRGVVDLTDTSGVVPVGPTFLSLGSEGSGINYLNGWLRRVTYYPRRLANAELQSITLPTGATITTQDYSLDTNFVGNTVAIGS